MKDDHAITKLTSGPCLMCAMIAFSSCQTKDSVPDVCIWPFSQADGFNTASTWDSDGLHSLQDHRSASRTQTVCVASHILRSQNSCSDIS